MLKFLVKLKVIVDRQKNYLSILNFIMIGYLFIEKTGFKLWYLILIPILLIWGYIDIKYLLPEEITYLHNKSALLRNLINR